jgi:hypothetical protein
VQRLLDRIPNRFEARFVEALVPIQRKLATITKPTLKDAKWFDMYVPNSLRAQQRALACFKSIEWLAVSHDAGYIARTPDVDLGDEPGTFRFTQWPAATFLKEMAREAAELVAAIITAVAAHRRRYGFNRSDFAALELPIGRTPPCASASVNPASTERRLACARNPASRAPPGKATEFRPEYSSALASPLNSRASAALSSRVLDAVNRRRSVLRDRGGSTRSPRSIRRLWAAE